MRLIISQLRYKVETVQHRVTMTQCILSFVWYFRFSAFHLPTCPCRDNVLFFKTLFCVCRTVQQAHFISSSSFVLSTFSPGQWKKLHTGLACSFYAPLQPASAISTGCTFATFDVGSRSGGILLTLSSKLDTASLRPKTKQIFNSTNRIEESIIK